MRYWPDAWTQVGSSTVLVACWLVIELPFVMVARRVIRRAW